MLEGCTITNIHKGSKKKGRDLIIYAELRDAQGNLVIAAKLDYIMERLRESLVAPA